MRCTLFDVMFVCIILDFFFSNKQYYFAVSTSIATSKTCFKCGNASPLLLFFPPERRDSKSLCSDCMNFSSISVRDFSMLLSSDEDPKHSRNFVNKYVSSVVLNCVWVYQSDCFIECFIQKRNDVRKSRTRANREHQRSAPKLRDEER